MVLDVFPRVVERAYISQPVEGSNLNAFSRACCPLFSPLVESLSRISQILEKPEVCVSTSWR